MNLRALQQQFAAHLLQGTPDIAAAIPDDDLPRLEVYHNAYRMQLLECLRDTFEKTWSWLGDEAFEVAGRAHIDGHPPCSWTLSDYGDGFDQTLRKLYPQDPEVAELAWLDWALRRAFDGHDAVSIAAAALAQVDWTRATFRLTPTLRMTSISTNCAALWTALAADETPPAAAALTTATALRVWRQELTPKFRSIGADEQRALRMILDGATFESVCAQLAVGRDDMSAAEAVAALLGSWVQDGLIVEVQSEPCLT